MRMMLALGALGVIASALLAWSVIVNLRRLGAALARPATGRQTPARGRPMFLEAVGPAGFVPLPTPVRAVGAVDADKPLTEEPRC